MEMSTDYANSIIKKEQALDAVKIIERCWCSFRDRQMFQLLKYAICTAEHSLTYEILRKVSPLEADLLRDPVFQPKVKFRFCGPDFPPYIVFKVFIQSDGKGLKYFSGKKIIRPASEAAADACKQMGNRKYYNQMITDLCQTEKDKVTDELDVMNLKDYMQYLRNTDELPANLGGKDNTWRKLSLEVLPRQNIMHDVMTFLNSGFASSKLKNEMPELLTARPITQKNQLDCIRAISEESGYRRSFIKEVTSGRRTKKAKQRIARMRKIYGLDDRVSSLDDKIFQATEIDDDEVEDNWEEEGRFLYEWSQELSSQSLGDVTPW